MNLLDAALVASIRDGAQVFQPVGGFTPWCRLNGISPATGYRHRTRIIEQGSWQPKSRRPKRTRAATPSEIRREIVVARAGLGVDNGAENIGYRLQQIAVERDWAARGWRVPSRATIHKILLQEGLVVRQPHKRPKSSYRRFSYARPRDCYQIDATTVTFPQAPPGGLRRAVVMEVIDDHSRVLVASIAADAETAAAAVTAIQAAFTQYGVPAIVLSDNGAAFTSRFTRGGISRFTRTVTAAQARLIHSSPYHPQTCGKVERHHRTFKAWLARQPVPATLPQLQALCDAYRLWYNTQRRHSAVSGPPQRAWDTASALGGPQQPPAQTDATVYRLTVQATGVIYIANYRISLGRAQAGHTVTAIRDGDQVTIYHATGTPLGRLTIDPTKRYQGQLTTAA
jgi:transposase InsO family protein